MEEYKLTPEQVRDFLGRQDEELRIDVADPESWVLARILLEEGKDEPHVLLDTLAYGDQSLPEPMQFTIPSWYQDLVLLLLDTHEDKVEGSCELLPSEIEDMMDAIDRGEKVPLD